MATDRVFRASLEVTALSSRISAFFASTELAIFDTTPQETRSDESKKSTNNFTEYPNVSCAFLTVRGIQPASEVGKFCNVMSLNFSIAFLTLEEKANCVNSVNSVDVGDYQICVVFDCNVNCNH